MISCNLDSKQNNEQSNNQKNNSKSDSLLPIFSLGDGNNYDTTLVKKLHAQKCKKKNHILKT
ncbi:hypothetical protein HMPREF1002_05000 [Porphyromonas sp. 31_2]|nr:hypothetical protein HMPREF1002_05000 [Porphyromonas sp. 31_2]